jgi:hypothetical protein
MQEAEGLATHDILRAVFHGYLACHNRLAAEAPPATPVSSNHNVMASNHPQAVTPMFMFVLSYCRVCCAFR